MIDICKEFGIEFDVAICFNRSKEMIQFDVYLNNTKQQCVDKVKHLGITVRFNLVDDHEIRRKKGDFIGHTNSLRAQYGKLSSDVQSRFFNNTVHTSMGQRHGI